VSEEAQPALKVVGDLDQIYYWTRDMDAAVAFFRDVVGLTLLRREGDGWAEFDAGPVHLALHRSDDPPASGTAVFRVDDLDAARRVLESRGVVFDAFVGEAGGFARFATFRDPDGDPVQIIEYRH
jgi:predicted enzyme related to lactoylglutathione lyase